MTQYKQKFAAYIETIVKAAAAESAADQSVQAFIPHFYDKTPLDEIELIAPEIAANIARSVYEFAQTRIPGKPALRCFTAEKQIYGFKTERLVIEIINDDMPFLVDSVSAELGRLGVNISRIFHPVMWVKRDASGKLVSLGEQEGAKRESIMHLHVSSLPQGLTQDQLLLNLRRVLAAVQLAVRDWKPILAQVKVAMQTLEQSPAKFTAEDMAEVKAFIDWLLSNNFIFLGAIEYDFPEKGEPPFAMVNGSEKGLFCLEDSDRRPRGLAGLAPAVFHQAKQPQLVEITKSSMKSPVHRPVHMDYVSLKKFNAKGEVVGEYRFLGLFTSRVYYQTADEIPLLRQKIIRATDMAGFDPVSHNGKALKAIMEFFPRDELFQIDAEELFQVGMGILSLDARPDVRLFTRKDRFERFISCMLYVPRDRYSSFLREKIQVILERAYKGKVADYYTQLSDSPLARLNIILRTEAGNLPDVNAKELETEIADLSNLWSDALLNALVEKYGEEKADLLYHIYKNAFPASYVTHYNTRSAAFDVQKIDEAVTSNELSLDMFRKLHDEPEIIHLKAYSLRDQMALTDILPRLENMGFRVLDENPYLITPTGQEHRSIWVRDLRLTPKNPALVEKDLLRYKPLIEEALRHVWIGHMENDGFNALVLEAGLHWRDIVLLRAYSKYLKQVGLSYSQEFVIQALVNHPQVSRRLVSLFYALFEPGVEDQAQRAAHAAVLRSEIDALLNEVTNIAEDRVIRRILNAIESTLRTNFFQMAEGGEPKDYISFKFDSKKILELPLPRPFREIFVYSMKVEGIHLRGGKVARGGLRWSDRHEDFRTEILGLVKAQMVKNAIIVPVGSKGGFVVKQPPLEGGREAYMAEGISCYKTFLRGLLDLTDNIVSNVIVPPQSVVRLDEDDPYLVVAADKGTATFSDIANSISLEYKFWLGDAFASGGSAGYDHKKMAITARGGWVSVERHFHEIGKNIGEEDFTVAGVGDMAGDVFGNGMLLSKHIRLVAAFNHMHIFLDPNPDAANSFKERERMFNLPRSSWSDYDAKQISEGGGIYLRSEKQIPVSSQMVAVLGLDSATTSLSPDELIKAILRSPVDLLWNGGIGTYVKARSEVHEDVGDRSNNAVRINGNELRCKVVGEGGNLGFTQLGRIEYAQKGGRINTDALDNSAGVDCSDHEVNIKIALQAGMENGKLTLETRDVLLVEMTDEVARLVLRDNELQNQALSNTEALGHKSLDTGARVIRTLERSGLLNREIEFLPSDEQIAERKTKKLGFTRPELAVILSYSKLALYEEILHSSLPDDPYFARDLERYFPAAMQKRFAEEIATHPLRREIIATMMTNSMVNRVGSAFFFAIAEDNGVSACDVTRAFTVARDAFDLRNLWREIEGLLGKIPAKVQAEMFVEITRFVARITEWFLRNSPQPVNVAEMMKLFGEGIQEFSALMASMVPENLRNNTQRKYEYFVNHKAPKTVALRVAELEMLSFACDIVRISMLEKMPVREATQLYFDVGQQLRLGWLRAAAEQVGIESDWDRVAVGSIINELSDQQRRLTQEVIRSSGVKGDGKAALASWQESHAKTLARLQQFMEEMQSQSFISFPMLVVAMRNVDAIGKI